MDLKSIFYEHLPSKIKKSIPDTTGVLHLFNKNDEALTLIRTDVSHSSVISVLPISGDNGGSITIDSAIVLPIFLQSGNSTNVDINYTIKKNNVPYILLENGAIIDDSLLVPDGESSEVTYKTNKVIFDELVLNQNISSNDRKSIYIYNGDGQREVINEFKYFADGLESLKLSFTGDSIFEPIKGTHSADQTGSLWLEDPNIFLTKSWFDNYNNSDHTKIRSTSLDDPLISVGRLIVTALGSDGYLSNPDFINKTDDVTKRGTLSTGNITFRDIPDSTNTSSKSREYLNIGFQTFNGKNELEYIGDPDSETPGQSKKYSITKSLEKIGDSEINTLILYSDGNIDETDDSDSVLGLCPEGYEREFNEFLDNENCVRFKHNRETGLVSIYAGLIKEKNSGVVEILSTGTSDSIRINGSSLTIENTNPIPVTLRLESTEEMPAVYSTRETEVFKYEISNNSSQTIELPHRGIFKAQLTTKNPLYEGTSEFTLCAPQVVDEDNIIEFEGRSSNDGTVKIKNINNFNVTAMVDDGVDNISYNIPAGETYEIDWTGRSLTNQSDVVLSVNEENYQFNHSQSEVVEFKTLPKVNVESIKQDQDNLDKYTVKVSDLYDCNKYVYDRGNGSLNVNNIADPKSGTLEIITSLEKGKGYTDVAHIISTDDTSKATRSFNLYIPKSPTLEADGSGTTFYLKNNNNINCDLYIPGFAERIEALPSREKYTLSESTTEQKFYFKGTNGIETAYTSVKYPVAPTLSTIGNSLYVTNRNSFLVEVSHSNISNENIITDTPLSPGPCNIYDIAAKIGYNEDTQKFNIFFLSSQKVKVSGTDEEIPLYSRSEGFFVKPIEVSSKMTSTGPEYVLTNPNPFQCSFSSTSGEFKGLTALAANSSHTFRGSATEFASKLKSYTGASTRLRKEDSEFTSDSYERTQINTAVEIEYIQGGVVKIKDPNISRTQFFYKLENDDTDYSISNLTFDLSSKLATDKTVKGFIYSRNGDYVSPEKTDFVLITEPEITPVAGGFKISNRNTVPVTLYLLKDSLTENFTPLSYRNSKSMLASIPANSNYTTYLDGATSEANRLVFEYDTHIWSKSKRVYVVLFTPEVSVVGNQASITSVNHLSYNTILEKRRIGNAFSTDNSATIDAENGTITGLDSGILYRLYYSKIPLRGMAGQVADEITYATSPMCYFQTLNTPELGDWSILLNNTNITDSIVEGSDITLYYGPSGSMESSKDETTVITETDWDTGNMFASTAYAVIDESALSIDSAGNKIIIGHSESNPTSSYYCPARPTAFEDLGGLRFTKDDNMPYMTSIFEINEDSSITRVGTFTSIGSSSFLVPFKYSGKRRFFARHSSGALFDSQILEFDDYKLPEVSQVSVNSNSYTVKNNNDVGLYLFVGATGHGLIEPLSSSTELTLEPDTATTVKFLKENNASLPNLVKARGVTICNPEIPEVKIYEDKLRVTNNSENNINLTLEYDVTPASPGVASLKGETISINAGSSVEKTVPLGCTFNMNIKNGSVKVNDSIQNVVFKKSDVVKYSFDTPLDWSIVRQKINIDSGSKNPQFDGYLRYKSSIDASNTWSNARMLAGYTTLDVDSGTVINCIISDTMPSAILGDETATILSKTFNVEIPTPISVNVTDGVASISFTKSVISIIKYPDQYYYSWKNDEDQGKFEFKDVMFTSNTVNRYEAKLDEDGYGKYTIYKCFDKLSISHGTPSTFYIPSPPSFSRVSNTSVRLISSNSQYISDAATTEQIEVFVDNASIGTFQNNSILDVSGYSGKIISARVIITEGSTSYSSAREPLAVCPVFTVNEPNRPAFLNVNNTDSIANTLSFDTYVTSSSIMSGIVNTFVLQVIDSALGESVNINNSTTYSLVNGVNTLKLSGTTINENGGNTSIRYFGNVADSSVTTYVPILPGGYSPSSTNSSTGTKLNFKLNFLNDTDLASYGASLSDSGMANYEIIFEKYSNDSNGNPVVTTIKTITPEEVNAKRENSSDVLETEWSVTDIEASADEMSMYVKSGDFKSLKMPFCIPLQPVISSATAGSINFSNTNNFQVVYSIYRKGFGTSAYELLESGKTINAQSGLSYSNSQILSGNSCKVVFTVCGGLSSEATKTVTVIVDPFEPGPTVPVNPGTGIL